MVDLEVVVGEAGGSDGLFEVVLCCVVCEETVFDGVVLVGQA